MMISDKTYKFLKWFALAAIPAVEAFWLTVGKVWGFPYVTEIGTTIAAVGLLIATLIGVSSRSYYKAQQDSNSIEYEEFEDEWEEGDEGEH